jgi:uncharacterized protein (TIGR03435 family)
VGGGDALLVLAKVGVSRPRTQAKGLLYKRAGSVWSRRFRVRNALASASGYYFMRRPVVFLFVCLGIVRAQASFEVASIKPHPGTVTMSGGTFRGPRLSLAAITLLNLITDAYDLRSDQVSGGPSWASSDRYDLDAKAADESTPTKDQQRQMLQALLADRFQLRVHRETRDLPVYALVVAKNGPKLKVSSADAKGNNFVTGTAAGMHMEASRGTMENLARQLSITAGRPVVDKTGLTGYFAFTLDWTSANGDSAPDSDIPSTFTAVQEQLGLRLESQRAPVEMLFIDHAARPSEN